MRSTLLKLSYGEYTSPLGKLYFALSSKGICFLSWKSLNWQDFQEVMEEKYYLEINNDTKIIEELVSELDSYFKRKSKKFKIKPDLKNVTPFQEKVLNTTYSIPFGQIWSYGELAAGSGYPDAHRAVGSTMRINPVPIVIPCHRVVKSDGSIGNFGGRMDLKKQLLMHEGIRVDENFKYK
ncbi:methylated-DNA--[protein]-cysteine S-methyltransferase [candidate division KSB1 bacterium]